MSLKDHLIKILSEKGNLTYGEVAQICVEEGYKVSTGERRLRKSESPFVEPIEAKSRRGTSYIKAYQWKPPLKVEQGQYVLPL